MISDVELLHFEAINGMFGNMALSDGVVPNHLNEPFPQPPEAVQSNTGQEIRIFYGRQHGFHGWFPAHFTLLGKHFPTIEHYIIWQKARFFGDVELAEQALCIRNPVKLRRMGQKIRGFQLDKWQAVRDKIMYSALRAKFTQNPLLFEQLRGTGQALLAEATTSNMYWTCGVDRKNLTVLKEPNLWVGGNRLGHLLMDLREELNGCMF